MTNLFPQLINHFSLVTPVIATGNLELTPGSDSTFSPLTGITAGSIISGAISLVLIVVVIVFFFTFILGGIKWLTSSGDEKKLATARNQISHAFVGLIIVFSSWAIINLIQTIFNVDILSKGLSIPSFNSSTTTTTQDSSNNENVHYNFNTDPSSGHINMTK